MVEFVREYSYGDGLMGKSIHTTVWDPITNPNSPHTGPTLPTPLKFHWIQMDLHPHLNGLACWIEGLIYIYVIKFVDHGLG